ncbi:MAG: hypothetical protein M3230_00080 [Thermoproteota archaeon]|nr:hypothetical protein [Thermoproteota archaeon]
MRQRRPRKEIALLVSKQERGLLFLVACHRVLGLVAAINKVSRTKKFQTRFISSQSEDYVTLVN